jgi:hypothetical protein
MRLKLGIAALLLLACSALAARFLFAPAAAAAQAQDLRSNTRMLAQAETPTPTETLAEIPTDTDTPILPTDTPTQGPPPVFEAWTGHPTYPESIPGYLFLVQYDTALWSRGDEVRGEPSLVSKRINNCIITQAVGRGLPPGWLVDDDSFQTIGEMRYEVVRVSRGGMLQFINYFGGDGNVFTGFRVEFQYGIEDCLQDAEVVFATLTSVLAPTPTATVTPEPPMIFPTDTPTETPADLTVTPTP